MEFESLPVPLHRIFRDTITVLSRKSVIQFPPGYRVVLDQVIDCMGTLSAKAQGLGAVITTLGKLMGTDQRLYVHCAGDLLNGILKVGKKNLFIRDSASGRLHEIAPLCVLDFYVHESVQRSGVGKLLFEHMLIIEKEDPFHLGYDRPSPKLLGFLRKHYGLSDFDPQSNNFVVFKNYFRSNPVNDAGRDLLISQRPLSASRNRRNILQDAHTHLGQQSSQTLSRAGQDNASVRVKESDSLSQFASRHVNQPRCELASNERDHLSEREEQCRGASIQDQATGLFLQSKSTVRHRSVSAGGNPIVANPNLGHASWQRSNAQYGAHIVAGAAPPDRPAGLASLVARDPYTARDARPISDHAPPPDLAGAAGWRYNPHDRFTLKPRSPDQVDHRTLGRAAGGSAAITPAGAGLVSAAVLDRARGHRLW